MRLERLRGRNTFGWRLEDKIRDGEDEEGSDVEVETLVYVFPRPLPRPRLSFSLVRSPVEDLVRLLVIRLCSAFPGAEVDARYGLVVEVVISFYSTHRVA